jgi:hypothetical protein
MMLYISAEDFDSSRCGPKAGRFLRRKTIPSGMLAPTANFTYPREEKCCSARRPTTLSDNDDSGFPEYMLAIKRYRVTDADSVNKCGSSRCQGSYEARQPLRVAADTIFYCPTGVFNGISVG